MLGVLKIYFKTYNHLKAGKVHNKNLKICRWFSRYVIAAMLVDGKQKIAH